MLFTDVIGRLEAGLRGELPGASAQARLAPIPRRDWPSGLNPARVRNAAGLLLVFPERTGNAKAATTAKEDSSLRSSRSVRESAGEAHVVLTVRADSLGRHGGQVSLPGGVVERGETFEQAALRESHEEIALAVNEVRVLGALTPIDIPVSGFRLHPIVAVVDRPPLLTPTDGEVAEVLEIPVHALLDRRNLRSNERVRDGLPLVVPTFHVAHHEIWGATAMVLAEFLTILGWGRSHVHE